MYAACVKADWETPLSEGGGGSCEFIAHGSWPCAGSLVGRYGHLEWKGPSYDIEILPTGFTSHLPLFGVAVCWYGSGG